VHHDDDPLDVVDLGQGVIHHLRRARVIYEVHAEPAGEEHGEGATVGAQAGGNRISKCDDMVHDR
jgi:hypothetical protein